MSAKIAVVIPLLDELENVDELILRLDRALEDRRGSGRELVFVVEGKDGTHRRLLELASRVPDIVVSYSEERSSLGHSLARGLALVSPDVDLVVTMDGDLNHRPEEISRLIERSETSSADIVIGSRDVDGSRVVGTPRWKRALSRLGNWSLARATATAISDKSSGFRVYRRSALAQLVIRRSGFSFLADLVVQAELVGMKIVEEPIEFVHRTRGRSKLPLLKTGVEYLTLIATGLARRERWLALWLTLGVVYRTLLAFPVHRFYAESDAMLTALTAQKILEGSPEVSFNGTRIGAIGCYYTAAWFAFFGATRLTLVWSAFLLSVLALVAHSLIVRTILGRDLASWALPLVALPVPALSFWTYPTYGYSETVLLCLLGVWLGARAVRSEAEQPGLFWFAVAAGAGFWTSILTLCASGPAAFWIGRRKPRVLSLRSLVSISIGFLLGSLPWFLFNLSNSFPSVKRDAGFRFVGSLQELLANIRFLATARLMELFGWVHPLREYVSSASDRDAISAAMTIFWASVLLAALAIASPQGDKRLCDARLLLFMVVLTTCAANALSRAGAPQSDTVRYVLPLALVLPFTFPLIAASGARRLATAGIALALAHALAATYGPWHPVRQRWQRELTEDRVLVGELEHEGVTQLFGRYSQVYAFNFVASGGLIAVPIEEVWDVKHAYASLPAAPGRWALLARGEVEQREIELCGRAVLPEGRLRQVGEHRWLWSGGPLARSFSDSAAEAHWLRSRCLEPFRRLFPM